MRAYDMGWSNPCPPLEHIPCWKHTSILPGTISSKRLKSLSECSFGRSQRFQPPFTQRPTPPRTYWWNNLGTTVHKASGQKTARLGFTWVMNICGLTRVHFFETNTHKPIPKQEMSVPCPDFSGPVFWILWKSKSFIQVRVIFMCAWFFEN